jgi:peptidyl-prolyl cis-trans isomerase C
MRFIKSAILFGTVGGVSVITALYAVTVKTDKAISIDNDNVVASVNNEKIYKSGIDIIVDDLKKSGTSVDNKTRETLIQRLVEQKLVAQYAVKQGYDKRDDVKKQIQVMTEMVLQDRYFADFFAQKVTPQAIKTEFDKKMTDFKPSFEYKASHILVDSQKKADDIKKQLNNANNNTGVFADLAQKYSSDSNAQSGGDLGYFSSEMMVQSFSDAVAKLSVGQISEPVKTDFGWHIIQLTDKRSLPKPTLEQLTPQIKAQLSRQFMQQHIAALKKKSDIQVFP